MWPSWAPLGAVLGPSELCTVLISAIGRLIHPSSWCCRAVVERAVLLNRWDTRCGGDGGWPPRSGRCAHPEYVGGNT
eukprot:635738-Pyramimonas_sp.AAC.1